MTGVFIERNIPTDVSLQYLTEKQPGAVVFRVLEKLFRSILLNDLSHVDDDLDQSKSRLMHSRASSALNGPKALSEKECARIRRISNDLFE